VTEKRRRECLPRAELNDVLTLIRNPVEVVVVRGAVGAVDGVVNSVSVAVIESIIANVRAV
jgi:hypothetical protein